VLALATHRLTQLVVEDEITRPARIAVAKWARGAEEFSFRERVDFALNCPACSSIYAGALILGLSKFTVGRWVVRVLAASGAALGWKAVMDKLEN
jgi:hypothetical protein